MFKDEFVIVCFSVCFSVVIRRFSVWGFGAGSTHIVDTEHHTEFLM